jgi:non-heme chloroperoxidase
VYSVDPRGRRGTVFTVEADRLILWGEHDGLFSHQDQMALTAAIPGARLIAYPHIGHCPNWERPDRVAADLEAFIEGDR